jgi:anti-sigma regulatory factor (Ser/Thr protein kinase)
MKDLPERRSQRFACSSAAPTLGRDFVSDALTDWGVRDEFPNVALVTSELVTNAVRHAGGPCTLAVALVPDRVRVEVFDGSTRRPVPEPRDSHRIGGWGLQIIDELATQWGSEPRADGKVVWCEVGRGTRAAFDETRGATE